MARFLPTLSRYRIPLLALALSAALHAAVMVGLPKRIDALDEGALAMYSATLDTSGTLVANEAAPVAAAAPRPARSPRPRKPRPTAPPPPSVAEAAPEPIVEPAPDPAPVVAEAPPAPAAPEPMPAAAPEVLAQAAPKASEASEPDFTAAAFPNEISIQYQLTSAFADGRATYHWEREGDSYRITGEAAAEGFFTLFLEGTLLQESRGTVTRSGLRPERFSENRPGAAAEGLEFDWAARKVTFDRNGSRKTSELADNTVDWLSMIFQLAHAPPHGQTLELRVFTQRKLYRFELLVLGEETIDIPLGSVRALHLRHVDKQDPREVVDVWLGVEQHNLPVKLRYPVARNRLVVEQVATRVSTR